MGRIGSLFGRVFTFIWALLFMVVPLAMYGLIGKAFVEEIAIVWTYKPAEATVTAYQPASTPTDDDETDKPSPPQIEYSFTVDDILHKGSWSPRQGNLSAKDEFSPALEKVTGPGGKVTAWYDPGSPDRSTLNPAPEAGFIAFFIFLTPFLLIGVVAMSVALRPGLADKARQDAASLPRSKLRALTTFPIIIAISIGYTVAMGHLQWRTAIGLGLVLWLGVMPALIVICLRLVKAREVAAAARRAQAEAREQAALAAGQSVISDAPKRRWSPVVKMAAGAVFVWAIISIFLVLALWGLVHQVDAQRRFEPVAAKVLSSRVKVSGDSDGTSYTPVIKYRYTVAGRQYTCDRAYFGLGGIGSGGSDAGALVARFPRGKAVTAYYDPANPASAVLDRELPGANLFLMLFLQPFLVMGVAMVCGVVALVVQGFRIRGLLARSVRLPWRIPGWGVLRQEGQGFVVWRRPSIFSPLRTAAIVYAVGCFVSIFVLALLLSNRMGDLGAILRAVEISAGVGAAAGVLSLLKLRGRAALAIDPAGQLSIARRKGTVTVALADVQAWVVRPGQQKEGKTADMRNRAVLSARLADGKDELVHVFAGGSMVLDLARGVAGVLAQITGKGLQEETATVMLDPSSAGSWPMQAAEH